jgi:hypothetical protein
MDVKYPECIVPLTGEDGNVFLIIGRVRVALREHLRRTPMAVAEANRHVEEFTTEVTASESYDEALAVVMRWVTVE